MTMPNTINVCGVDFSIVSVDNSFTDGVCGETDNLKCIIRINSQASDSLKEQTLIHEWVHAALVMVGRNDESQDENLVQCLAMAINQTFSIKEN